MNAPSAHWRYPGSPPLDVLRRALDQAASAAPMRAHEQDGYARGVAATLRWLLGVASVSPLSQLPVAADHGRCRAELARTRSDARPYTKGVADTLRWARGEPPPARLTALRRGRPPTPE